MNLDINTSNNVKIVATNVDNKVDYESEVIVGKYKIQVKDILLSIYLQDGDIYKLIYSKFINIGETQVIYIRGSTIYESKQEYNSAISKELLKLSLAVILASIFSNCIIKRSI